MSDLTLKATTRAQEESPRAIRREGNIPAILYGHKIENQMLNLPYNIFYNLYREAGENTLIDLAIDGKEPFKVIIHDVDRDEVSNKVRHVDLYQVKMDEKIETEIPIHFIGESPAVKEMGGVLLKQMDALPVKCLPNDLIKYVEVDLSNLKDLNDVVRVADITIPSTLEVLRDGDEAVTLVTAPREEKEPVEEEGVAEEAVLAAEGEEAKPEEGAEIPDDTSVKDQKKTD